MGDNTNPSLFSWPTLLLALITYPIIRVCYNVYLHPLANTPGPRSWASSRLPFVWSLLKGTIVHDIERLHRQYGPILRIAPDEVTFASDEAWHDIFQPRPDHQPFLKDPTWWRTQPRMPQSLISAIDPDHHARIRRVLAPGFTPRALKAQEPILHRYASLLIDRLRGIVSENPGNETTLDIGPWFNYFTFDLFGDLGFGESFNCLQHSQYHPWIRLLFNSVKAASYVAAARFYPWLAWLLIKCIPPSLKKMQADHYQQIVDKVDRRLNLELTRPDIMSHVIEANGENQMPPGEIYATFMVLTTAGSETTATVLTGTLNYLLNSPDKLAVLTAEVRDAFPTEQDFTLERLRKLPHLHASILEGLRLCPPIPWVLPRLVPRGGDTIHGQWFPEGVSTKPPPPLFHLLLRFLLVSCLPYSQQADESINPSLFSQPGPEVLSFPTEFQPERWLPDASTDPSSPFRGDKRQALQPFSMGLRSCMGQHLAWAEMRLVLARLLWAFDVHAVDGRRVRWEDLRTFLLVEKKPMEIRLCPRRAVS
ncbi:cytochrome P450 [Apiospora phragmitis]|uniref:Cytochrome P450 n=1 Tax=Apiospora phragmitis TaxID=2905665 RepID=A0ABR1USI5_9PEZI